MTISARNVFTGSVTALVDGPINAEVELTTPGGDKIIATLTEVSAKSLGLAAGSSAVAVLKASAVVLQVGGSDYRFSARNQLPGTVSAITKGVVSSNVELTLAGGSNVCAVVTNEAVEALGLAVGSAATALFKAGNVLVGVPA